MSARILRDSYLSTVMTSGILTTYYLKSSRDQGIENDPQQENLQDRQGWRRALALAHVDILGLTQK